MEIKKIADKQIWEDFLATVQPHTFLQSWNWGEFNAQTGHKIWRLGIYKEDVLVAASLVLKVTARRGSFLFVPHGPVSPFVKGRGPLSGEGFASIINALTNYLIPIAKQEGCAFIRISPLLSPFPKGSTAVAGLPASGGEGFQETKSSVAKSDHPPFVKEEVFTQLGYRNAPIHMMHPELAWLLDLTPNEDKLLAGMRKTTRYSIKKAEKDGVTIRTSTSPNDLKLFEEIYSETVKRQEFKAFPSAYFSTELEVFSKENQALLFFAEYQGKVVGTAFIIFYGNSAFYHHGATTRLFPSLTDAQLLQWHVIKEAKRRGLRYYNFWGVVAEDQKNHPWWGLSTFKRGFGGEAEAYVHAQDLVLSPRYWLTFTIEKLRKIRRRL